MRKYLVAAALVVAVLFAGCAKKKDDGPKTIKVLTMQQAGLTVEEMNAIVAEFNQKNPNVKVAIEYVSYDALHDKIVTSSVTNPPSYDVALIDDIWFAEFSKAGFLYDLSSKISPEVKAAAFDSSWAITSVGGKVYGMPWLLDCFYLYYNKDMVSKIGAKEVPKTWEDLVDQARKIKKSGAVEYPLVMPLGQIEASVCVFVSLLEGAGGSLVDASGKPSFNDEKGVKTLQWLVDLTKEGILNPASITYSEEDCRNVFSQKKAAFTTNWLYMYELAALNAKESNVVGKVGLDLVPAFAASGLRSAAINGSMGFAVFDKSPNKDAAWEYVKYLTSEDVMKRYSAHLLPIWKKNYEGADLDALMKINEATPATVPAFKAQIPFSKVRPKVAYYPEGSKQLQLALQQALTKQSAPKAALDAAAAEWVKLGAK